MPAAAGMKPLSSSEARRASDSASPQAPCSILISDRYRRHIPGYPAIPSRWHQRSWASVHSAARCQSPREAHASIDAQQMPPAVRGCSSPPTAATVASSRSFSPSSTWPLDISATPVTPMPYAVRSGSPSRLPTSSARFPSARDRALSPTTADWKPRPTANQPCPTFSGNPSSIRSARFSHASATGYAWRSMLSVPRLMAAATAVCMSPAFVAAAYARSRASIATGSCPVHQAACARVSRSGGVSCPAWSADASRSYASRQACRCSAPSARSRRVESSNSVIGLRGWGCHSPTELPAARPMPSRASLRCRCRTGSP